MGDSDMNFKKKAIRSPQHLAYVRSRPCMISGDEGRMVVAHHLLRAGGKGMGIKACDSLVVPLTSFLHDMLHRNGNEVSFFANHGLSYEKVLDIAKNLARNSPDIEIRNKDESNEN